jgi:hypothetical protein
MKYINSRPYREIVPVRVGGTLRAFGSGRGGTRRTVAKGRLPLGQRRDAMFKVIHPVTWGVLAVLLAGASAAAERSGGASHDLLGEGVGLVGYDPVSYFPEGGGKPEKGHIMTSSEHEGVVYRFASEAHKALFDKSPAKYLPAFGGWCTWAVAELGKRVDVDPEAYVVKNGRLYLFYRDPKLDTRAKFLEDPDGLLKKAEANWPTLSR